MATASEASIGSSCVGDNNPIENPIFLQDQSLSWLVATVAASEGAAEESSDGPEEEPEEPAAEEAPKPEESEE